MKQLVIMPGGFHPFHAGHAALYNSAREAFPGADVYVAATNDTSNRPFPFPVKEKLAQLAGVAPNRFVQVKSPFRAEEIVHKFDPNNTQLIFVRSEKDAGSQPKPGGTKKDGSPSYLQPYDDASDQPLSQRAYMAYLPTVEFGPGMTSATEIRGAWPKLNEKRKTALVMSLYPKTQSNPKLAATVVKLLDTAMGSQDVAETINSSILNTRFKHKQVIGDYTYTATAEDFEGAPLLWIKAYDGNKEIGHILFEIIVRSPGGRRMPSADYLESGGTEVDPAYRNKGVASTMYAYAKMLGNDIRASYNQTSQGKAMWAAWEKAGDAKHLIGTAAESVVDENQGWAATLENTAMGTELNETIGPHQNELLLMLRTDKPAAIIDRDEIYKWREYIQENGWTMLSFGRPPIYSGERVWQSYIISKDPATAMQIRDLMDGAFSGKIKFNSAYHAKLGKLLGYSAWDIAHFILKGAVTGTGRLLFDFFKQLFSKDAKQSAGKEASKPLGIKENTAPNPQVNLTPNFPNYSTLIGEFLGVKKNRAVFRIIAAELRPGQGETEKITRALAAGTPVGIDISRVKNRAVLEALKPDAFAALQQAKQNIEQNRQQEIDQWAQDFQANTASKFAPRPRPTAPAPAPVAQPGEKHSVLKARLTQLDQAIKKQQQLDALTQKLEYKGLLTPAMQQDLDTRLYVRGAAADNYQSLNQKLDRALEIATNRLRTNKLAFREDADYIEEAVRK